MTERQKKFAMLYLENLNATQAAIGAGYSEKTADRNSYKLLKIPEVSKYINDELKKIKTEKIADIEEIMGYLTSVLRGEISEEVIIVESKGDGVSAGTTYKKQVSAKDRLKAAELLGKRYSLYSDGISLSVETPIIIAGEDALYE